MSAVALASVLTLSACSDDSVTLDDLGITDSPAAVIATALSSGDTRAVLGPDELLSYLQLRLVPGGYSWADAACGAQTIRDTVGDDRFNTIKLYEVASLNAQFPQLEADIETCMSPESVARRDHAVTESDITIRDPQPGPDPDLDVARSSVDAFFDRGATLAALTQEERSCIFSATFGTWSDDDWLAFAQGSKGIGIDSLEAAATSCLDEDRLQQAAGAAGKVLQDALAETNPDGADG